MTDEEALLNPTIQRDAEQVMAAHDLLGFLSANRPRYHRAIHPETWIKIEAALDVLCWLLGHNDEFADAIQELAIIIAPDAAPDAAEEPGEAIQ